MSTVGQSRSPLPEKPPLVAELSVRIPGGPGAPAEARDALRRFHPELAPELMQIVALLASELVSNAVRHARAESVELCFGVAARHVRVEVADNGRGFAGKPRAPIANQPGGWGLYIVERLASRWGVTQDDGTRVWFEIDR
jgi:nitrate/nitrite-specific signal transduction histidine kinase